MTIKRCIPFRNAPLFFSIVPDDRLHLQSSTRPRIGRLACNDNSCGVLAATVQKAPGCEKPRFQRAVRPFASCETALLPVRNNPSCHAKPPLQSPHADRHERSSRPPRAFIAFDMSLHPDRHEPTEAPFAHRKSTVLAQQKGCSGDAAPVVSWQPTQPRVDRYACITSVSRLSWR